MKDVLLVVWLIAMCILPYKANSNQPVFIEEPIHGSKVIKAALIVDAKTKKVLHYNNPHTKVYPASLTKMMTIYIALSLIYAVFLWQPTWRNQQHCLKSV